MILHEVMAPKGAKLLTQTLVIVRLGDVLEVEVDTLELGELLVLGSLVRATELLLTLALLLSTSDKELLTLVLGIVELIDGGLSLVVVLKVDETEAFGLAVLVTLKDARGDLAVLGEELLKLIVGDLGVDVLGVDVGEASTRLLDLGLTLLAGDVVTDVDLLVVQKHAVDVLDGSLGSLGGLVVDETVAERASVVGGDLARKNVTESGKGIVKGLVVDTGVEVLDEDVALTVRRRAGSRCDHMIRQGRLRMSE